MRIIPALLVAAMMVADVAVATCGDQTITCPTAGATMNKPGTTECTTCDDTDCCTADACEADGAPDCLTADFQTCEVDSGTAGCVCMDNYSDATPNVDDDALNCAADACSGSANTCGTNEDCTNSTDGMTATCSCSAGFVNIDDADPLDCQTDPCTGNTDCDAAVFEECVGTSGSAVCVCMDNYSDATPNVDDDALNCAADACSGSSNTCGTNEDCTNSDDGMTAMCSCSDTFADMDADEAVLDCQTDPCPGSTTCDAAAFEECVGTSGSAVCECMDGYTDTEDGDALTCIVDGEGSCSTETAECTENDACAECMSSTGDGCMDNSTTCDGMKEMYCCNAGEDCSENTLYLAYVNCAIELSNCTVTALCEEQEGEDGATSGAISPFFSSSPKFTVLGALASTAAAVFAGNPL